MSTSSSVLAIIPARGGSKRFPRKNVALLAGKPLLAYAIQAAQESAVFQRIIVSSEDAEILGVAAAFGAEARPRPQDLAGDTAQVRHVCRQLLAALDEEGNGFDSFAILLPTNPFRSAEDIRQGYDLFVTHDANYVMSLAPYSHPPQRAVWAPETYVQPYFGVQYMRRTQELDPLYRHDGALIFAHTAVFREEFDLNFYGSKIVPYYIPPERSVDIDNPLDLAWAEFLLQHVDNG